MQLELLRPGVPTGSSHVSLRWRERPIASGTRAQACELTFDRVSSQACELPELDLLPDIRCAPGLGLRVPLLTGHLDEEVTMSVMEEQRPRSRRSFTDEFKRDVVALVIDEGRTVVDVARALGVGEGTLGNWVRQARVDRGERGGVTTSERTELAELRRENARLRMERDLLKRATAFWVKESGQ